MSLGSVHLRVPSKIPVTAALHSRWLLLRLLGQVILHICAAPASVRGWGSCCISSLSAFSFSAFGPFGFRAFAHLAVQPFGSRAPWCTSGSRPRTPKALSHERCDDVGKSGPGSVQARLHRAQVYAGDLSDFFVRLAFQLSQDEHLTMVYRQTTH